MNRSTIRTTPARLGSRLLAYDVVLTDDTDNVNAAVGAIGQQDPPIGITS